MDNITVRGYTPCDIAAMARIWNEVVASGDAFPQDAPLGASEAASFFAVQTHCAVAVVGNCASEGRKQTGAKPQETKQVEAKQAATKPDGSCGGKVAGLYILHPNNVGRCGHIANASYAVSSDCRGEHIGEALVKDCLKEAARAGYRVLQFNAVVAANTHARHLYERLGFMQLGTIKGGFRLGGKENGTYVDICPYYISLV